MTKKMIKKVVPMLIGTLAVTMVVSAVNPTTLAEAANGIRYSIPRVSSSVVTNKKSVEYISQEEAKAIAMKKAPKNKSEVTKVETLLGYEDPHYNVEITSVLNKNLTKIFTIKVDGVTGKIEDLDVEKIINNKDKDKDKDKVNKDKVNKHEGNKNSDKKHKKEEKEVVKTNLISRDKAIKIALDKIGRDADLEEMELDKDDNPPKYEIEMYNDDYEYEIEIHAITGAILKFEKE
ncbi:PepSY domain-containing protein [Tissierella sp. MB52-C2]|uniref:PepSY domain-containing protein n=1 Tax=Tissierella sp. MB52-C2 TaxID=3070999 RepID=UPI00280BDEE0|nr:PepSY domain-containing protein [Tissierella sp. MB52-C2]WMM24307.1 PepSY domain-containing protein [Tissierella sp. MB52-C2]